MCEPMKDRQLQTVMILTTEDANAGLTAKSMMRRMMRRDHSKERTEEFTMKGDSYLMLHEHLQGDES